MLGYVAVQAANLFERTVKGLARCVANAPVTASRWAARDALLSLLVSLDAWSGPLKVRCVDVLDQAMAASAHSTYI